MLYGFQQEHCLMEYPLIENKNMKFFLSVMCIVRIWQSSCICTSISYNEVHISSEEDCQCSQHVLTIHTLNPTDTFFIYIPYLYYIWIEIIFSDIIKLLNNRNLSSGEDWGVFAHDIQKLRMSGLARTISTWFWNEDIWLPPGYHWESFNSPQLTNNKTVRVEPGELARFSARVLRIISLPECFVRTQE